MQAADTRDPPLRGLYSFVREHLAIVNGLVLTAGSVVAVLDFLAPRFMLLPLIVYSATAGVVVLMALAAVAPLLVSKALGAIGLAFKRPSGAPLWRRPAWQAAMAVFLLATVAGFASIARADQGGLIASRWPAARELQASVLGIRHELAGIGQEVRQANQKLDLIVADSRDPQKDLVARGYSYDDMGMVKAIRQADLRALSLFSQAGYRATSSSPLSVLLGAEKWEPAVVAALPRSMFGGGEACAQATYFFEELRPPGADRLRAFARLCDTKPAQAILKGAIERDATKTPPTEWHARQAKARVENLAALARVQ